MYVMDSPIMLFKIQNIVHPENMQRANFLLVGGYCGPFY